MTVPGPLVVFLLAIVGQRLIELVLSARNARVVRSRGARLVERDPFGWIVVIHTLFPIALVAEVVWFRTASGSWAPAWLALWIAAQLLRYAAVRALGDRWNVRVMVVPGEPPVRRGPYRWFRHPNYLAVLTESVAGPMMFGAWRTALLFLAANLIALSLRIRVEDRALAEASTATDPGFVKHRSASPSGVAGR